MGLYNANYHAESYRSSRPANAIRFGAADDGAAAAIAAELGAWTTGRLTSLQKKLLFNNALPYPLGTRLTLNALGATALNAVYRVRARNLKTTVTEADVVAFLTGVTGATGIGATLAPLSAPPSIPNGAHFATVATTTIVNKF